jgi:hypothetical protein
MTLVRFGMVLVLALLVSGCMSITPNRVPDLSSASWASSEPECVPSSGARVAELWTMAQSDAATKISTALGHEVVSSDVSNPGRPAFNTTHGRIVFIEDFWRTWPLIEYTLDETWPSTDPAETRGRVERLLEDLGLLYLSVLEWELQTETLGGSPMVRGIAQATFLGRSVQVPGTPETSMIAFEAWNTSRIVLGPIFDLRKACPTLSPEQAERRFIENVLAEYSDVYWDHRVETSFTSMDGRLAYSFRLPYAIRPSEPCPPFMSCSATWDLIGTVDAESGETSITMKRVGVD